MIFILTAIVARATVILLLSSNTIVECLFEKNEKIKLFFRSCFASQQAIS
jgi:hypothetical protein